eukprot:2616738-Pyramimonas_sp.AAC.2
MRDPLRSRVSEIAAFSKNVARHRRQGARLALVSGEYATVRDPNPASIPCLCTYCPLGPQEAGSFTPVKLLNEPKSTRVPPSTCVSSCHLVASGLAQPNIMQRPSFRAAKQDGVSRSVQSPFNFRFSFANCAPIQGSSRPSNPATKPSEYPPGTSPLHTAAHSNNPTQPDAFSPSPFPHPRPTSNASELSPSVLNAPHNVEVVSEQICGRGEDDDKDEGHLRACKGADREAVRPSHGTGRASSTGIETGETGGVGDMCGAGRVLSPRHGRQSVPRSGESSSVKVERPSAAVPKMPSPPMMPSPAARELAQVTPSPTRPRR